MVEQLQSFAGENEADVHFLVGQEEEEKELISAHKLILSSSSEVFDAMFRFDAQNAKNGKIPNDHKNVVPISDVPAEAFKAMLRFIYSADLSQLNGQNAIAVLYAAKKYNVIGLIRACLDFPIGQLQNVFFAFAETHFLGENHFADQCLAYIDQNADALFQSDAFLQIDQSLLCDILSRDQLLIAGEFVIWEAALRWADEKCRQNDTECSAQNRRAMLGPALYKIRFPCFFETDFSTQIVPSGLLTECEVSSILQWHRSRPKPTCRTLPAALCRPLQFVAQFPTTKRNYECRATLRQKIDNFAELARQIAGDSKRSFDSVEISGLKWQLNSCVLIDHMVKDGEKLISFRFDIDCDTDSKIFFDREVIFETTFRICSQQDEKNDHVEKCSSIFYNNNFLIVSEREVFIETTFRICSQKDEKKNDHAKKGFSIFYNVKPFGIKKLWDRDLGWYNAEEDTLILEFRLVVRVSTAEEMAQKALSYGTHFLPLIRSSR